MLFLALARSASGAIHLHVRRVVGLEDREEGHCGQLYRNLTATVENLDPYYQFVECAMQNVTAGRMEAADGSGLTLRLLGKGKAWVVDEGYDPFRLDEFGPIFHHVVKQPFTADQIQMYDLNVTEKQTNHNKTKTKPESVSCGMHNAPYCTMCVINLETGEWVGESWCHGDCTWIDRICVLSSSDKVS